MTSENSRKVKEFDFLLTLEKLCKNNSPIVHTTCKVFKLWKIVC